ncbi:DNA mismatch repair protein MutS [Planctomycetales bacterium]|nr:DNA mismatch repair protein MutS [Planctomycetales bacterium]
MMKQFYEAKKICPDALLLFRMGDFYEMFHDDARVAAPLLGLALTSREKGPDATPMAGFPLNQIDNYIAKIIAAGYRAAVCDQVEDPKKAKGIVKRAVTRIVTAGTITEDAMLDPKRSNYLTAVWREPKEIMTRVSSSLAGIAWVELSTGAFYAASVPNRQVAEQLARISPSEIIFSDTEEFDCPISPVPQLTKRPDWTFGLHTAYDLLLKQFGTATLEGFGFTDQPADVPAIRAAGAILDYLNETQRQTSTQIDSITAFRINAQLEIDEASRRSLEITSTIRGNRREGSLLAVLDRSVTPMGSRYLGESVAGPLVDIHEINQRLDAVEEFYHNDVLVSEIRDNLRRISDIQRIMTRVLQNRGTPRDLSAIGRTLRLLPFFKEKLANVQSPRLIQYREQIDTCEPLAELLTAALVDNIPLNTKEGGFIRTGFSAELDELRQLQSGGKEWIAQYQVKEIERSGIPSLKVGYTQVFGYYIEITNTHQTKIPNNYIRKQTLKNAERYITSELQDYEVKVLTAADKSITLEHEILAELRQRTCDMRQPMRQTAKALAALDVIAAMAALARERGYCRPKVVEDSILNIVDGRHPVLDALEPAGTFVPNDTILDPQYGMIQLITGPNMSGKSTFIRQTALLCIMAQLGSFIPARDATIGICDRIFARVGASDDVSRGQSTFMVEMTETARILNQATAQSLVILDEIGRGTSTYDGLSLAWAIVEYLHDKLGSRTMFATHYHELTDLSEMFDRIRNLNVAVSEKNGNVAFLHKIVPGAADKSYGIHVAKIAGVPKEVVQRAGTILDELEQNHVKTSTLGKKFLVGSMQFSLFGSDDHPVIEELRELNVDDLKPLEALKLVAEWKRTIA